MLTADGSKSYEFVVTADITGISSNQGGETGNRLTITGNGFGDVSENVSIEVGGLACVVKSVK
jgi:hypothetical protein